MNESLGRKKGGMSAAGLRTLGVLFLVLGVAGRCLIQNGILGMANSTSEELLALLDQQPELMSVTAVALVLEMIYGCAVPVFVFLLVEGFCRTGNYRKYLTRVLVAAVITELPYNLAMGGGLWVTGSRNPVFALVIGLVVLYFYQRYAQRSGGNLAIKAMVTVAAVLWVGMLRIDDGIAAVLLTAVVWTLRGKPNFRTLGCCAAAIACTLISPYYALSPMSFIATHFYNEEKGGGNRILAYCAYPAILLMTAILSKLLL